jgi:hypothetical protein
MNDGQQNASWDAESGTYFGMLTIATWQHVALTVNGGQRIISLVVNGTVNNHPVLCRFGWERVPQNSVTGAHPPTVQIAPTQHTEIWKLRMSGRYLRTSNVIDDFPAGV